MYGELAGGPEARDGDVVGGEDAGVEVGLHAAVAGVCQLIIQLG